MKRLILILALAVMVGCSTDDNSNSIPLEEYDCYECFSEKHNREPVYLSEQCGSMKSVRDWMDSKSSVINYRIVCTSNTNGRKLIKEYFNN